MLMKSIIPLDRFNKLTSLDCPFMGVQNYPAIDRSALASSVAQPAQRFQLQAPAGSDRTIQFHAGQCAPAALPIVPPLPPNAHRSTSSQPRAQVCAKLKLRRNRLLINRLTKLDDTRQNHGSDNSINLVPH